MVIMEVMVTQVEVEVDPPMLVMEALMVDMVGMDLVAMEEQVQAILSTAPSRCLVTHC